MTPPLPADEGRTVTRERRVIRIVPGLEVEWRPSLMSRRSSNLYRATVVRLTAKRVVIRCHHAETWTDNPANLSEQAILPIEPFEVAASLRCLIPYTATESPDAR